MVELKALGRVLESTPSSHFSAQTTEARVFLSKPAPFHRLADAPPNCLYITRGLVACTRYDFLRLEGSIVIPALNHFGVWFVTRPKPQWIGYGRLRKKMIEAIHIAVDEREERDWGLFCDLAKRGFTYG